MRPLLRSGPVHPVFRTMAWVLGPLLLGAGTLMVILDLRGVTAADWPAWSRPLHAGLWLGVGNAVLGRMLLGAARTGRDAYLSDDGDEAGGDLNRPQ